MKRAVSAAVSHLTADARRGGTTGGTGFVAVVTRSAGGRVLMTTNLLKLKQKHPDHEV